LPVAARIIRWSAKIRQRQQRRAKSTRIGQTEVAVSGGLVSWRNSMWKVGDLEPVKGLRAHGYPYGFNVTTEAGRIPPCA